MPCLGRSRHPASESCRGACLASIERLSNFYEQLVQDYSEHEKVSLAGVVALHYCLQW